MKGIVTEIGFWIAYVVVIATLGRALSRYASFIVPAVSETQWSIVIAIVIALITFLQGIIYSLLAVMTLYVLVTAAALGTTPAKELTESSAVFNIRPHFSCSLLNSVLGINY